MASENEAPISDILTKTNIIQIISQALRFSDTSDYFRAIKVIFVVLVKLSIV
jgi:hypothetical protein